MLASGGAATGGGNDQLQKTLDDQLTCGICLSFPNDCVTSQCCHANFCKVCTQAIPANECPMCRKSKPVYQKNTALQRVIDILPKKCDDCSTQVFGDAAMKAHRESCPDARTRCFFSFLGCGWSGKNRDMKEHLKSHRPACPKCEKDKKVKATAWQIRLRWTETGAPHNCTECKKRIPKGKDAWNCWNCSSVVVCRKCMTQNWGLEKLVDPKNLDLERDNISDEDE